MDMKFRVIDTRTGEKVSSEAVLKSMGNGISNISWFSINNHGELNIVSHEHGYEREYGIDGDRFRPIFPEVEALKDAVQRLELQHTEDFYTVTALQAKLKAAEEREAKWKRFYRSFPEKIEPFCKTDSGQAVYLKSEIATICRLEVE